MIPAESAAAQGYPYPGCGPTNNTIVGTPGNDLLEGTPLDDLILALAGNDAADGESGDDCLLMGPGNDRGGRGLGP